MVIFFEVMKVKAVFKWVPFCRLGSTAMAVNAKV